MANTQGLKPFKPGQSGNPAGRPKGSRNKLGEQFIEALQADFEEHGKSTIEVVRLEKPDQYLKVIASLLPRDVNLTVNEFADKSDDDIRRELRELAATLGALVGPGSDQDEDGGTRPASTH